MKHEKLKVKETKTSNLNNVISSNCFAKDAFMLVEHINNDSAEIEYGDVIGETQGYFIVKPHLRKEQNSWLKVDCKVVEYYQ